MPRSGSRRANDVVRPDVAHDDERGVGRRVETPVVRVQIVAGHRVQIRQPADGRMAVRMRGERRGRDLHLEQLVRIVLAAHQLRDDHGALDSQSSGS